MVSNHSHRSTSHPLQQPCKPVFVLWVLSVCITRFHLLFLIRTRRERPAISRSTSMRSMTSPLALPSVAEFPSPPYPATSFVCGEWGEQRRTYLQWPYTHIPIGNLITPKLPTALFFLPGRVVVQLSTVTVCRAPFPKNPRLPIPLVLPHRSCQPCPTTPTLPTRVTSPSRDRYAGGTSFWLFLKWVILTLGECGAYGIINKNNEQCLFFFLILGDWAGVFCQFSEWRISPAMHVILHSQVYSVINLPGPPCHWHNSPVKYTGACRPIFDNSFCHLQEFFW